MGAHKLVIHSNLLSCHCVIWRVIPEALCRRLHPSDVDSRQMFRRDGVVREWPVKMLVQFFQEHSATAVLHRTWLGSLERPRELAGIIKAAPYRTVPSNI